MAADAVSAASERAAGVETGGILVLDFGSQFAQLITRRVREMNVHAALVPYDIDVAAIRPLEVVLDGGSGMAGRMLGPILSALPVETFPYFLEPDGAFPDHQPNPLLEENRELDGREHPVLEAGWKWLRANLPRDTELTLNWGDSRPGNMIWRNFECVCATDFEAASISSPRR